MKNNFLLSLFIISLLFIFSCKKDSLEYPTFEYGDFFWKPYFSTSRNTDSISIHLPIYNWGDYLGKQPQDPDFFDIYIGEHPADLVLTETIKFGEELAVINNLMSNKPYYCQVITRKEGLESDTSQLMMTTLGTEPTPKFIYSDLARDAEQFQFSFDENYFSFSKNRGKQGVYFIEKDASSHLPNKIADNIFYLEWSPIKNELVYLSYIIMDNKQYPLAPIRYNVETREEDTLFTIPFGAYFISELHFTTDGQRLFYTSTEGNTSRRYDFWTYDLTTQEKRKHSDFISNNFEIYTTTVWQDGLLYLNGSYNDKSIDGLNLYTFNYVSNDLEPILPENQWRNFDPYPSPSGNKLAFFSDRSGQTHLWIYDFTTKTYKQITDGQTYGMDRRSARIIWESEEEIITSVYVDDKYSVVSLVLE